MFHSDVYLLTVKLPPIKFVLTLQWSFLIHGPITRLADGKARSAIIGEYDFKTNTWHDSETSPFPNELKGNLKVALIVDKMVVVGEGMQVAIGSMRGVEAQGKMEVSWQLLGTTNRLTNIDP